MPSEKVTRSHVRANRPILIPSVPVSERIEIRHGCRFLSSLVRALAKLPGGSGRYPKGSALELLDGTLKLRHCTDLFTKRFPPWSLPRVGYGGGKRACITLGHLPDAGGNVGERVRLTRKTPPGVSSHSIPDPGHPTPRRWKRLRSLSSEGEGGEVGVPCNFFSPCCWVRFALGTPGICLRREQA